MSGEDDRGQPKRGKSPFFDESDVAPPARPRRRAKPPPNIITAGGVDMARGHASGIQIREGVSPEPSTDQPRVVIAVETDLRKVPTHRRLLAARDPSGDGSRAAVLPDTPPPANRTPVSTAAAATPGSARPETSKLPAAQRDGAPPAEARKLPVWMRLARRAGGPVSAPQQTSEPPVPSADILPPPPRLPPPAPTAVVEAPRPAPPSSSVAPIEAVAPAPHPASALVIPRPVRTPSLPSPRATFTPPFQLPSEKN
jgi:hypothetical protein